MKTLVTLLMTALTALSVSAQVTQNTVTLNIRGDQAREITIDGKSYTPPTSYNNNFSSVVISDLQPGQHSLQVIRTESNYNNTARNVNTNFTLRNGYDLTINVNANGGLQMTERFNGNRGVGQYSNSAMSNYDFGNLYRSIQRMRGNAARTRSISNAFNYNNYSFTSYQVKQLIQLVNSQRSRIDLAKAAYHTIVDPANFSLVYSLLNQAGRNEVIAYVDENSNTTLNSSGSYAAKYHSPMSSSSFDDLYSRIQNEWYQSSRLAAIRDAFANTNNYFTSYQASRLVQLASNEYERLELAKASFRTITDPANFTIMYNLLNSQADRDTLAAYVNSFNNNGSYNSSNNGGYTYQTPMSDANFNTLYQDIQRQWFPGSKMNALRQAFSNTSNHFTSYQASQLIQLISDEDNRLELAKMAYSTVTDPSNYSQVINLLSSQTDRDALTDYINIHRNNSYNNTNNNGYNYGYRTPMTDANFTTLYQNIQRQWFPGSKMNALRQAFSNTSNYFTTNQASQLIQLISDENNRLELAKAAYRTITDPANFTQIYDILSSQADRDELAAYVRNYKY
ncbi:MAG: DUF4476 domain-containing protein [Candidatus Dadabacteria bacterium]